MCLSIIWLLFSHFEFRWRNKLFDSIAVVHCPLEGLNKSIHAICGLILILDNWLMRFVSAAWYALAHTPPIENKENYDSSIDWFLVNVTITPLALLMYICNGESYIKDYSRVEYKHKFLILVIFKVYFEIYLDWLTIIIIQITNKNITSFVMKWISI